MNPCLLRTFQLEVVNQCQFAIMAIKDLENALKNMNDMTRPTGDGMTRIWYSIQAFLIAAGNLSKLLWPPHPVISERGPELRASLSVEDNSCLQPRTFRNHFEHYDQRLEEFFLSLEPPNFAYIDRNVSPGGIKSLASHVDEKIVLRHLDQEAWTLLFRGEPLHLKPLVKAVCELLPKAEQEADKRR
jgi:hypothetical protein